MTATTDATTIRDLIGDDDQPGILDEYIVFALPPTDDRDQPLVIWRCDNGCGPSGEGHVGIIARDLNLTQTGLTVGELVDAVLRHRHEDHPAA